MRILRAGLGALLLAAAIRVPAARAESYSGRLTTGIDYVGLNPFGGVTGTAFQAACRADRAHGGTLGTPAINAFLQSAANGLDAKVYDLGSERFFSATATGPGPVKIGPSVSYPAVGPQPAGEVQLTSYDLDIFFLTAVASNTTATHTGCIDANTNVTAASGCYGRHTTPDESACVVGWTDPNTGIKHGARYVMVSAAINATANSLPYTLTLT
ncbi:MAG TPA: hypothetical protein VMY34_07270 [Acidimicrobiales bacterium]|nr:hypothetical protein [Acidimicrobiales bacterium]